jgi:cell division protein FtsL
MQRAFMQSNAISTGVVAALIILASVFTSPAAVAATADFRLYLNESCIVADEPVVAANVDPSKALNWAGLLVSNPAQTILTGLIRGIAKAIGNSAARKEYVQGADRDLYLYVATAERNMQPAPAGELGCMTLVSGMFDDDPSGCVEDYQPVVIDENPESLESVFAAVRDRPVEVILRRANVCLAAPPDLFIESRLELSEDGTAFRMRNAGLVVNSLSGTRNTAERRALLQTVSIFEPSANGRGSLLAGNWTNFGEVAAGMQIRGKQTAGIVSGWTKMPAMSAAASRAYQSEFQAHNSTAKEIAALERRILRQFRQISALEEESADAGSAVRAQLQGQIDQLEAQISVNNAVLRSLQQEYRELPATERRYMPVTVSVTLTETRSEKELQAWLANFLEDNSVVLARHLTDAVIGQ